MCRVYDPNYATLDISDQESVIYMMEKLYDIVIDGNYNTQNIPKSFLYEMVKREHEIKTFRTTT